MLGQRKVNEAGQACRMLHDYVVTLDVIVGDAKLMDSLEGCTQLVSQGPIGSAAGITQVALQYQEMVLAEPNMQEGEGTMQCAFA